MSEIDGMSHVRGGARVTAEKQKPGGEYSTYPKDAASRADGMCGSVVDSSASGGTDGVRKPWVVLSGDEVSEEEWGCR